MREKTILLRGGRDLDVVPLEGADEFLMSLLGEASSTPAVPYLRSAKNAQGTECIGVFIGSQHVGYLLEDTDATLLATIQACELNGAVARARGNLIAPWDRPGQVRVKVSLADSEHLLSGATEPSVSLEDGLGAARSSAAPDALAAAPLAAGHSEDYPDWPPQKPKTSAVTEPLVPIASTMATETAAPLSAAAGSFFAPTAPQPSPPTPQPAPPTPRTTSPPPTEAHISAPSEWLGGASIPARAPQSGWLGSPGQSAQGSTASPMGTATTAAPAGDPAALGPEQEIIAAWTSSPPRAQPTVPVARPTSSGGSKTWILTALAVIVLVAAAVLIWKFVFAPKTYTDADYGYSFTYPGRWELLDAAQLPSYASLSGRLLDIALAGHGAEGDLKGFGLVMVTVWPAAELGDSSQLTTQMQMSVNQSARADTGITVLEPVSTVTVGGTAASMVTIDMTRAGLSLSMTVCFLIDGELGYALYAVSTKSGREGNQKAFDRFLESFKLGAIK